MSTAPPSVEAAPVGVRAPYAEIYPALLLGIATALKLLVEAADSRKVTSDWELNNCFRALFKQLGNKLHEGKDRHLRLSPERGIASVGASKAKLEPTRIAKLVRLHFERCEQIVRDRGLKEPLLPSPLAIVYDYLCDPQEPATRAYALTTVRTVLFEEVGILPRHCGREGFDLSDILEAVGVHHTFRAGRDPLNPAGTNAVAPLVRHFLAVKGYLFFRPTWTPAGKREGRATGHASARTLYLDYVIATGRILRAPKKKNEAEKWDKHLRVEFGTNPRLERIPDANEIYNEIAGIPVPIRGLDLLFGGGILCSDRGGLVIGVGGLPGTGKTSFALCLSAALAPLGTQTFFVAAEESEGDLKHRLLSIVPEYMRRLSFFPADDIGWFVAVTRHDLLDETGDEVLGGGHLRSVLSGLIKAHEQSFSASADKLEQILSKGVVNVPIPCPYLIVIDGVDRYFRSGSNADGLYNLELFVRECRSLGALVVLTFAQGWAGAEDIDYLVDTRVVLCREHNAERDKKPARSFVLEKTRHQLSRSGAHGLHFSGDKGFRITPQIPSLLDRGALLRQVQPDKLQVVDVMNMRWVSRSTASRERYESPGLVGPQSYFCDIQRNSQVVIFGVGSCGKASLALKLALSPLRHKAAAGDDGENVRKQDLVEFNAEVPHVLVVSFLYGDDYYKDLERRITHRRHLEYPRYRPSEGEEIRVEAFYPGYISPEDLFFRVFRRMEEAELEGRPFTSVVIDGLHNVQLQFPMIAAYQMIWPQIFSTLRRRGVTLYVTHTKFEVEVSDGNTYPFFKNAEVEPLLHALVSKVDYVFAVERYKGAQAPTDTIARIWARSAIGERIPRTPVLWSRQQHLFVDDQEPQLALIQK